MKKVFIFLGIFFFASTALAQVFVPDYTRKDGTHVPSHYRSNPDNTPTNNYDFKGNTNPYNGQQGHDYYRNDPRSPYYNPNK